MEECIFCKIIKKEIPAEIVWEGKDALAFRDINPKVPVHILLIPKEHLLSLSALGGPKCEVVGEIFGSALKIAEKEGIAESGFRIILNKGRNSGQEVAHLHFHLLGGKPLGPMLSV